MSDLPAEDGVGQRAARRWLIRGKVQGVGFRPAVARCAARLQLDGAVSNVADGVLVELEGAPASLAAFVDSLQAALPPLAEIATVESEPLPARGRRGFTVGDSPAGHPGPLRTRVPPDTRLCDACRADVGGSTARRGGYAFVSCVDCGPRYSIITAMPFDRQRTAMRAFTLCADCAREYADATDRRFHAQTNACQRCGPQVRMHRVHPMRLVHSVHPMHSGHSAYLDATVTYGTLSVAPAPEMPVPEMPAPEMPVPETPVPEMPAAIDWLELAATALRNGAVVALRGVGGYQLLADPRQDAAVHRLRFRKTRPAKPLAVLISDLATARQIADFGPLEESLLASPANPIVVVRRRADAPLSPLIQPGLRDIGLMLPTTPLHALLAERCGPLVATSANRDSEPLIYTSDPAAASDLQGLADLVITHDRAIARPVDDSVVRVIADRPTMLRVGRGYAPLPLALPQCQRAQPAMVALGGHQKAAFALFNGDHAVLGPHIGDLESEPARQRYEEQLRGLLALYGARAAVVAHDAHPDYHTSRLAREWPAWNGHAAAVRLIAVQHHHAHVVAAMAEHGLLSREVLGVAWDGTGWGPDGTIWGGEFLRATATDYQRVARLRPFALPGGERAVREPWRVAVSLLAQAWNDPTAAAKWLAARWNGSRSDQYTNDEPTSDEPTNDEPTNDEPTSDEPTSDRPPRNEHTSDDADRAPEASIAACARLASLPSRSGLAPWTSSAGRLFDGVAALVLAEARGPLSYEGQAAALWEAAASDTAARDTAARDTAARDTAARDTAARDTAAWKAGSGVADSMADSDYALECSPTLAQQPQWELDWRPLVRTVVRDVERGRPAAAIAAAFHAALADGIAMIADRFPDAPTVLGGGVFQNGRLVELTAARFAARGRWLGTPGWIPVNDGGLAAGQLAVALAVEATGLLGSK